MQKIASPRELQAELKALMAFVHHSTKPDRQAVAAKIRELADRVARRPRPYSFLQDWNDMTPKARELFLKQHTDQSDHIMDQFDLLLKASTAFRDADDLFASMIRDGYIPTIRDAELLRLFIQAGIPYYGPGKPFQPPKSFIRHREKEKARAKKNRPTFDLTSIIGPTTMTKDITKRGLAEARKGKKVLLGKPAFELYEDDGMWAVQQPQKREPDTFGNLEQAFKFLWDEWMKGSHLAPVGHPAYPGAMPREAARAVVRDAMRAG
jgi:hypothetical protein